MAVRLIGRDRERRAVEGLGRSQQGGSSTVVRGAAGTGKTSLLACAAEEARRRGVTVFACTGLEAELSIPFGAVADLLRPVLGGLDQLPRAQRTALAVSLALEAGPPAGPLAACTGALNLLGAASERQPLLILVDDFQWIDVDSRLILQFVARRLREERVTMLIATRDGHDCGLVLESLPSIYLAALPRESCAQIARELGLSLDAADLDALMASTGGNPLAVVENLRMAVGGRTVGPLYESLEGRWSQAWSRLPPDTRQAMLMVAQDYAVGGSTALRALEGRGLTAACLAPAEMAGLVGAGLDRLELRHPLVRQVIVGHAGRDERADALHALAAAAAEPARTWLLADAASGPDETLAQRLEDAAQEAAVHNGTGSAAQAYLRAAELSPGPAQRAGRLFQAARFAFLVGVPSAAVHWCEDAAACCDEEPAFVLAVQRLACYARTTLGDLDTAYESLMRAAQEAVAVCPGAAAEAFAEASAPAAGCGDMARVRAAASAAEQIWREVPDAGATATRPALAMACGAFTMAGDLDRARGYMDLLEATAADEFDVDELAGVAFFVECLTWAER